MRDILLRKLFPLLVLICSLVSVFILNPIYAAAAEATDTIQHVYDKAELLSASELSDIEDMCASYGEDADVNIFILTHDDASAVDGEIYIENFFDDNLKGSYDDSVILLVDMANRDIVIEGYGTAETYIHSQRIDSIIQEVSPYLTDGDYVSAFETFIKSSNGYMKDKSDPNYSRDYTPATENNGNENNAYGNNNYGNSNYGNNSYGNNSYHGNGYSSSSAEQPIYMNVLVQLGVAVVIGAVAVGIMAYNAGGRMTVSGNTYMDQDHSGLIGRRDDYIRTTVTRVRKPETNNNNNNNSGGGFHGGVSAGGSSHSTGRGGF